MSTKSTLACGETFSLYCDVFEDDAIYLRLKGAREIPWLESVLAWLTIVALAGISRRPHGHRGERLPHVRFGEISNAGKRGSRAGRRMDRAQDDGNTGRKAPVVKNLDAKILVAISNGKPRLGVNYPPYLPSLEMSRWHACKTTHCRAGWAIALAGRRGYALERKRGPSVAGALIYHASTGRIPEFYASNEDALADIQKCAKEQ